MKMYDRYDELPELRRFWTFFLPFTALVLLAQVNAYTFVGAGSLILLFGGTRAYYLWRSQRD